MQLSFPVFEGCARWKFCGAAYPKHCGFRLFPQDREEERAGTVTDTAGQSFIGYSVFFDSTRFPILVDRESWRRVHQILNWDIAPVTVGVWGCSLSRLP